MATLFTLPIDFICFGSGSSGNCYYLRSDDTGIIIDLGIGIRAFKQNFLNYGFKLPQIKAILVTHDHLDHVRAVGAISSKNNIPVYSTAKVFEGIDRNPVIKKKVADSLRRIVEKDVTFEIGPFRITPFHVPHDSADNNGYFVECGDVRFCLMTDIGEVLPSMKPYIERANYIVMESNHDIDMLMNGPYPYHLKRRVSGPYGHISNTETAQTLKEHMPDDVKRLWLCHLSAENNTPAHAVDAVNAVLKERGLALKAIALNRQTPTGPYKLE